MFKELLLKYIEEQKCVGKCIFSLYRKVIELIISTLFLFIFFLFFLLLLFLFSLKLIILLFWTANLPNLPRITTKKKLLKCVQKFGGIVVKCIGFYENQRLIFNERRRKKMFWADKDFTYSLHTSDKTFSFPLMIYIHGSKSNLQNPKVSCLHLIFFVLFAHKLNTRKEKKKKKKIKTYGKPSKENEKTQEIDKIISFRRWVISTM